MAGKPYHRGTHKRIARTLCAYWTSDPTTHCLGRCTCHALTLTHCTCGKACGRTLDEHRRTARQPAKWTAGHAVDGQLGGPYRPEVFACGASAGASLGNAQRNPEPRVTRWW